MYKFLMKRNQYIVPESDYLVPLTKKEIAFYVIFYAMCALYFIRLVLNYFTA